MKKTKLTHMELVNLDQAIESSLKLTGAKYSFALVKTQKHYSNDIEAVRASIKASKEFDEYRGKMGEMMKANALMEYPEKDGKPDTTKEQQPQITISGGEAYYKIKPECAEKFEKEFAQLREKYAVEIAKRKKQTETYNTKILKEFCEIEIHTLKHEDFAEGISLGHVLGLLPLIEPVTKTYSKSDTKFTNLGILKFRQFFVPILEITKIEFIIPMIENLRQITEHHRELVASKAYEDYYNIYDKARIELCESNSSIDIYGNAKSVNGDYHILDYSKFDDELSKLRKKHKKIIDAYEELVNKEVTLSFNQVAFESLPEKISGEQLQVLADYISDPK